MSKRTAPSPRKFPSAYLVEVSWEVCNQVGGIYTVIRSKAPAMVKNWGTNYCMLGPYTGRAIQAELEPLDQTADVFGRAAANLRSKGYRSEEHTSELQSRENLVCRLLLE